MLDTRKATQERAYYLWLDTGRTDMFLNWLQAQWEIRAAMQEVRDVAERMYYHQHGHYPMVVPDTTMDEAARLVMRSMFSSARSHAA